MGYTYAVYLLLTLFGAWLFMHFFSISLSTKQKKAAIISLFVTTILFSLWDAWAVSQGHWQFGLQHMTGVLIGNMPLEEIGFFLIIPFFGLILWEIAGKMSALHEKKRVSVNKR